VDQCYIEMLKKVANDVKSGQAFLFEIMVFIDQVS